MNVRFSNDIVEIAAQQLGRGENDVAWMQEFMEPVGFVQGEEWCMRFARACWYWTYKSYNETLEELFAYNTGSSDGFLEDAEKATRVRGEPSPGAVVIYVKEQVDWVGEIRLRGFHCGICVAANLDSRTIEAIEGNTDETGRPDGYKVCRTERPLKNCRFVF